MKIRRFRIRPDVTWDDIIKAGAEEGGTWIHKESKMYLHKFYCIRRISFEFTIYVALLDDLTKWNDFDNVLVLDDDFGQPYTPFYNDWDKGECDDSFAACYEVVKAYNEFLSSLPFLEEIK